jgi:hypothetical protein
MLRAPSEIIITFLAHWGATYKLARTLGGRKVVNMRNMQMGKLNRWCCLMKGGTQNGKIGCMI